LAIEANKTNWSTFFWLYLSGLLANNNNPTSQQMNKKRKNQNMRAQRILPVDIM
jgi:hypothetical protein